MLLLDTNVMSVMISAQPDQTVSNWFLDQPSVQLATASVCQAEILSGIAILPNGRRRTDLDAAARAMFAVDFEGRILPFDSEAASAYAELFAVRRKAGRPSGTVDLMIAAIARVNGASVVTRNVADFEGLGLTIVNPWDYVSRRVR
jgi:predicted nucleic acid-binding protein